MVTEFIITGLLLFAPVALFTASVVANRRSDSDILIEWLYGLSGFSLTILGLWIVLLVDILFFVAFPTDVAREVIARGNSFEIAIQVTGGFAAVWAKSSLLVAGAAGIALLLAPLVDRVNSGKYVILFTMGLCGGLLALVGFVPLLEGLQLILGIVGAAIGIWIGVKKIRSGTD